VDQSGVVLDVLVQRRGDKQVAKRLLRKLMTRQMRPPRIMMTDKLASYGATKKEIAPGVAHRQHHGLNNRAENSHQPTRRRERQLNGSNQPVRRNASSPPATRSTISFISAATTSPPANLEPQGGVPFRCGPTSAGLLSQLDLRAKQAPVGPEAPT
jgi:transposase-like protein